MIMRSMGPVSVIVLACALGACVANPPVGDGPAQNVGLCNADAAKHLIGTRASAAVGADLMRLTGAETLRWVPPRTAVTMDYRQERLTVSYDDNMIIVNISCT
jgi:hypothetical protein